MTGGSTSATIPGAENGEALCYMDIYLASSHDYTVVNDAANTQIKEGATLEVEFAYVLRNTTSSVELEITELIAFTDTGKVEATFNLPL